MAKLNKRVGAVIAGTAVLAVVGTTGATAAKLIGSADIKNDSIRSIDIKDGTLRQPDLHPQALKALKAKGPKGEKGDKGEQGPAGPAAVVAPHWETLSAPKTITNIGGSIATRATQLDDLDLKLEAGTYLVTLDGAFTSGVDAANPEVDIYPQLSLYQDLDNDKQIDWSSDDPDANEGDISPNAVMPVAKDRHISASGSTVITVGEGGVTLRVAAFGYAADQSSERSGEINVVKATLTATPIG